MTNHQLNDKKVFDIYERSFNFAVSVAVFLKKIPNNDINAVYKKQLARSSASIGANLSEADGSLTKRDFVNKVGIARREARESGHWLKLIRQISIRKNSELYHEINVIIQEAHELLLILSRIILKSKRI